MTRASFDVVSVFGCLGASGVPGPAFAAVLAHRGYSALSVRNQLVRMVDRGLLTRHRTGRTSVYRRARPLEGGYELYSGGAEGPEYDGTFPALLVTIPENRRGERDRVLYVAQHCGYRPLRPGVLISVREDADELRERLQLAIGDSSGIDLCRLVPESADQARSWARRAFDGPEEEGRVSALERALHEARGALDLRHTEYFELFHEAAMLVERIDVLPVALRGQGPDLGSRARRLMGALVSLWAERLLDDQIVEVDALSCGDLVEWDTQFWRRIGRSAPRQSPDFP